MATKNLVPRESGSGNLGTTSKPWEGIFSDSLSAGSLSATTITANSISAATFAGINDNVKIDSSLVISGDKEAPFEEFSLKVLSMGLAASGAEPFIVLSGGSVGVGCGESITSGTFKLTVSGSMSAEGISAVSLSATAITADSLMYSRSVSANAITGASISAGTTLTANSICAEALTANAISATTTLETNTLSAVSITTNVLEATSLTATTFSASTLFAGGNQSASALAVDSDGLTSVSGTVSSITANSMAANRIIQPFLELPPNEPEPSISGCGMFKTVNSGGDNDYAKFLGGVEGQIITIFVNDNHTTFQNNTGTDQLNLAGAGVWEPDSGDILRLVYFNSKWYEIGRSDNT